MTITLILHLVFVAFLVVLVFAMARQGESMETLVKGLDLARRADAEAARVRVALVQEEQQRAVANLTKLIQAAELARARTDTLIRSGRGHSANGHK